ncbi:MAG: hypothetical protein KTR28_07305 [Micavibrio sp.]|nr:hypothetical protein [Micavibrio sp.]
MILKASQDNFRIVPELKSLKDGFNEQINCNIHLNALAEPFDALALAMSEYIEGISYANDYKVEYFGGTSMEFPFDLWRNLKERLSGAALEQYNYVYAQRKALSAISENKFKQADAENLGKLKLIWQNTGDDTMPHNDYFLGFNSAEFKRKSRVLINFNHQALSTRLYANKDVTPNTMTSITGASIFYDAHEDAQPFQVPIGSAISMAFGPYGDLNVKSAVKPFVHQAVSIESRLDIPRLMLMFTFNPKKNAMETEKKDASDKTPNPLGLC